ncbi:MAG: S8 family serine peptidase [Agriterribacter sp.]
MPTKKHIEADCYCSYCFYGLNPANKRKVKISIEKREDRITFMLKGDADERLKQKKIVDQKFGSLKLKCNELFDGVYEVIFEEKSLEAIDEIMSTLREAHIVTHHTYQAQSQKNSLYHMTDRVMIKFDAAATKSQMSKLLDRYKLKPLDRFNIGYKAIVAEVTDQSGAELENGILGKGKNPAKIANMLATEKIVDTAEVSLISQLHSSLIPASKNKDAAKKSLVGLHKNILPRDTYFNRQWNLHSTELKDNGNLIIHKDAGVNAPEAWDKINGGGDKSIIVAVIDYDIDHMHPDLVNQLPDDFENKKNDFIFISPGSDFNQMIASGPGHGTSCAGIALAERNDQGIAGIAYGCTFLPVWLDGNSSDELKVECFDKIGRMAHVISFSQSPIPSNMSGVLLSEKLTEMAMVGGPEGKGCVICVSAGNYKAPINETLVAASSYVAANGKSQPLEKGTTIFNLYAANEGVIAVTASTSLNTIASYNNFGKEISVCAPSADWRFQAEKKHLTTKGICTTAKDGNIAENPLYRDDFSGTSAAAPLVAGIAALILSANKDLSAQQVKNILQKTADKIPNKQVYDANGHSDVYGYGKVNAAAAVQMALDLKQKSGSSSSNGTYQASSTKKTNTNHSNTNKRNMPTVTIKPKPFVKWKFKCKTEEEKKQAQKRAKELLNYYLRGVANGLTLSNPFYPKVSYEISEERFAPVRGQRNTFLYSATVSRKSDPGATFPQPDSTKDPKQPKPPGL